jgi:transposase InsO family protein
MPWKNLKVMELREKFAQEVVEDGVPVAEACRRFGVSRPTGYKWLERFDAQGREGLADRSRAPRRIPHRTPEEVEARVLRLRERHPAWGPKKLRALLVRRGPVTAWPAASTIGEMLERRGLVQPQARHRRVPPHTEPLSHAARANDVWSVDFKGQFLLGNGKLCYPLTVTDNASRMLLGCWALPTTSTELVRPRLRELFTAHGLPAAIRSDNGAPFASAGVLGLSALSAEWLSFGVTHERMHLTLKQETARPGAADFASQQARFDEFREEFNTVRSHEALGQTPPAEHWQRALRRFPDDVAPRQYSNCDLVARVRRTGEVRLRKWPVYVGMALAGHTVGLLEVDPSVRLVTFAGHDLGLFEPGDTCIAPLSRGRAQGLRDSELVTAGDEDSSTGGDS